MIKMLQKENKIIGHSISEEIKKKIANVVRYGNGFAFQVPDTFGLKEKDIVEVSLEGNKIIVRKIGGI